MSAQVKTADAPSFVDLDRELAFWREHFSHYPFFQPGLEFSDYAPAFKLGVNMFLRGRGRSFDEQRDQLAAAYRRTRGNSRLDWQEACPATAAAWARMSQTAAA